MKIMYAPLAKKIIEHSFHSPESWGWKLMGMGKLQLDLDENTSLHVWHPDYKWLGVSMIHDHPWGFDSYVISGRIQNVVYVEATPGRSVEWPTHYWHWVDIGAHASGGLIHETMLVKDSQKSYSITAGATYHMSLGDIHETIAEPGTVTIIDRQRTKDVRNRLARVFWPSAGEFGNAVPRLASPTEIIEITKTALERLK